MDYKRIIKDGIIYLVDEKHAWIQSYTDELPEHITIPDKVKGREVFSIYRNAFNECVSLISIKIPKSIINIGSAAFYNCKNLKEINIPDNTSITINTSVFDGCESLTDITIPNGVTNIGNYTFFDCTSLKNITIPNSVTTIGDGAFYNCASLESIVVPDSVFHLGNHAFCSCPNLKTLHIPKFENTLTTKLLIGDDVPEIFFKGTKKEFEKMFCYDIYNCGIASNSDEYRLLVTVHCADGDLIC